MYTTHTEICVLKFGYVNWISGVFSPISLLVIVFPSLAIENSKRMIATLFKLIEGMLKLGKRGERFPYVQTIIRLLSG